MVSARLEAYLSRLEHEVRKHGPVDTTSMDEVREHLLDAVAAGLQHGLSVDAAEQEAFVRFGPPEMVAAGFGKEKYPMFTRLVIALCTFATDPRERLVRFLERIRSTNIRFPLGPWNRSHCSKTPPIRPGAAVDIWRPWRRIQNGLVGCTWCRRRRVIGRHKRCRITQSATGRVEPPLALARASEPVNQPT